MKIMYIGGCNEVVVYNPYKQVFKKNEGVEVTDEMAKILLTNPEFKKTKKESE